MTWASCIQLQVWLLAWGWKNGWCFGSDSPGLCCLLVQCAQNQTFPAAQSLGFTAKGFVQGTRRRLEERVQKEGVRTSLTRW